MLREDSSLFTASEAAALTLVPLKAVNNAIDKRTIATKVRRGRGVKSVRLIDEPALVYLALERQLVGDTTPLFRRKLFTAIASALKAGTKTAAVGALMLDVGTPRREVARRIQDLRRAERLVVTDPDILGGAPVFRGTRIAIHQVAELLKQGERAQALRQGYPRLTDEMIRLAPVFVAAHPLRGRPRKHAWGGRLSGRVVRVRLRDVASA